LMENLTAPEEETQKVYPVSVVYQQTKIFDAVLRKISRNPQIMDNFKRIFYTQPKIPSFIHQSKGQADQQSGVKFPKISQEDFDFFSLNVQNHLYTQPEKQSIYTPTWNIESSASLQIPNFPNKKSTMPDFDRMHKAIEILESRIVNEIDKTHFHTGQILEIAESIPPKEFTETEHQRLSRYRDREIPQKIPNNWEQRAWDKPSSVMSEQETNELYQKIEENKKMMTNKQVWDLYGKRKKKAKTFAVRAQSTPKFTAKKIQRRPKKAIVTISTISYETDSSSDNTDWEDFDSLM
jgi:hypothetical protein